MTESEQIISYLTHHQKAMISFLDGIVSIQSGSKNKPGVDAVGIGIINEMEASGFSCSVVNERRFGNNIIARSPGFNPSKKQILITGHMDTVFPHDTNFNFFKQDNSKIYGPGVADMKGGLVVGIYALKALLQIDALKDKPVTFIFNSDEEIGSPTSRALICKEAKKSRVAFVLEAGGLNSEIVTGRKGNLSARLNITGEAGHAAFVDKNKASAILELAHKTLAIEKLNSPEEGILANVGTIEGGIGPNTIPEFAAARIDFRFPAANDYNKLLTRVDTICKNSTVEGTRSNLEIVSKRPPMPQTKKNMDLFKKIENIAANLGITVKSELRQGVSDANFIAEEGIPVIDGLGPIGAKDHSKDEYILTSSLLERSILFGNILLNI